MDTKTETVNDELLAALKGVMDRLARLANDLGDGRGKWAASDWADAFLEHSEHAKAAADAIARAEGKR